MLAGAPTPKCWEAENYNGSNLKATTRAEGKHLESSGGPGKLRAKLGVELGGGERVFSSAIRMHKSFTDTLQHMAWAMQW